MHELFVKVDIERTFFAIPMCVFFCATLFMQFVFPRFFLVPEVGGSELSISSEVLRHCVCSQLKQSYISQVL